jgi:hypothetical protein
VGFGWYSRQLQVSKSAETWVSALSFPYLQEFCGFRGAKTPWFAAPAPLNLLKEQESKTTQTHVREEEKMLTTLAVILIVLWLLGLISSYTLGGWIHILLVVAIIAVLVRLISGRQGPPIA